MVDGATNTQLPLMDATETSLEVLQRQQEVAVLQGSPVSLALRLHNAMNFAAKQISIRQLPDAQQPGIGNDEWSRLIAEWKTEAQAALDKAGLQPAYVEKRFVETEFGCQEVPPPPRDPWSSRVDSGVDGATNSDTLPSRPELRQPSPPGPCLPASGAPASSRG